MRCYDLASGAESWAGKIDTSAPQAVRDYVSKSAPTPVVDAERVEMIRKAIEEGTYPLVPTKIADAIIAAGVILRSGK